MHNGVQKTISRTYRRESDPGIILNPTPSRAYPSSKTLEVAAGLAQANILMLLPLWRVTENYYTGVVPNQGDCLRSVLQIIMTTPFMLGKIHFQAFRYSFINWTCSAYVLDPYIAPSERILYNSHLKHVYCCCNETAHQRYDHAKAYDLDRRSYLEVAKAFTRFPTQAGENWSTIKDEIRRVLPHP